MAVMRFPQSMRFSASSEARKRGLDVDESESPSINLVKSSMGRLSRESAIPITE